MKFNKICIVGIFLLAILTFGAVSASDALAVENNTDVLSVQEDIDLSIDDSSEDTVVGTDAGDVLDDLDEGDADELSLPSEDNADDLVSTGETVPDIKIYADSEYSYFLYGDNNKVIIELPDGADGNFTVFVKDKIYYSPSQSGSKINVDVSKYFGNFTVKINYTGDNIFAPRLVSENFTTKSVIHYSESVLYKDNYYEFVYALLPVDANGRLVVLVDNAFYDSESFTPYGHMDSSYGYASISSKNLAYGTHNVYAYYNGTDYYLDPVNFTVNACGKILIYSADYNEFDGKVHYGDEFYVSLALPETANGTLYVSIGSYKDSKSLINGRAEIAIDGSDLSVGVQELNAYFTSDNDEFKDISQLKETITVYGSAPKITASDLTMFYNDGSSFKVKVVGTDGKPVKNGAVVIKINNKKVKTVKTNANGIAAYKISNLPKKYTISATYGKVSVSKKLTVKQPLSLKKVKVKKSAKKLVLTATLKGKKAYVSKKLIFKFNGKKYAAKTNKKGIAKVTIKKAVLKKLKVGKKIAYQVTFSKDTVKRTVKVGR